jgi:hypothetical protein
MVINVVLLVLVGLFSATVVVMPDWVPLLAARWYCLDGLQWAGGECTTITVLVSGRFRVIFESQVTTAVVP